MSDPKFYTGMVVHTEADERMILCIHPDTAIAWLQQLITNKKGWARFHIRKKSLPKGKVTHTLQQIDVPTSSIYNREIKPDFPEDRKEEAYL